MSLRSVFSMLALIAVLVPAELPAAQHLPDAMGKVNILENGRQRVLPLSGHQEGGSVRAAWDVLPGWPVTVPASGEEGGILVDLDGDSDLELVSTAGTTISAHNPDGTTVTGWPRTTVNTIGGAAAAGDIDGDGDLEIVVSTWSYSGAGQIVAWELDGTLVAGFPVDNGYAMRSVTLADLDGNGTMEIISNTRLYPVGEVTVYRGDGSIYPGWPQPITHVPAGSAAAGDIDGDGDPEVIGMSYDALFAWHHDGTAVSGFPFTLPASITVSYSSPVLADIDGDGLREIVFGACHESGGTSPVYVLNGDGTVLPGWPQYTLYWNFAPPAVCDLDGDGGLDVVFGDQVLSGSGPVDRLYAWDASGTPLAGFPVTNIDAVFAHPLAADLDGDTDLEILLTDNVTYSFPMGSGRLHAWHHDGTASADFPLVVMGGTTFTNVPCLGDLDGNGLLDLTAGGADFNNNQTNISAWMSDVPWNPAKVIIPCFQYNVRHDGLYPAAESVGTVAATFTCDPPSGTLPFSSTFSVSLENLYGGATRRIAARVNVTTGSGGFYGNWRSGYTNVAAGSAYTKAWNQVIPALGSLVGDNIFTLAAEDVTPAPYNQPPYPAAGDTATGGCTVTGLSP